jgi:hypothetical protein
VLHDTLEGASIDMESFSPKVSQAKALVAIRAQYFDGQKCGVALSM